jgi:adenylylsulfate reductase subunit A
MEKETCTFSYCQKPAVTEIECDLAILGGGMAGCGAAFEACAWANAKGLKVVMVDKAATDRSGAVAMGLLRSIPMSVRTRWQIMSSM